MGGAGGVGGGGGGASIGAGLGRRRTISPDTVTGMPALNAIRSVVAAPPGILTSADLPLRGFAGRFAAEVRESTTQ